MAGKVRASIGDVFQIPIDDARVGYGQVIAQPLKGVLYICAFRMTTMRDEQPYLDAILGSEVLLAGNTFDAKIWHGHWPVVGNVEPKAIALPNYKEGAPGQALVESFDQKRRRRATAEEERLLPYRSYSAPMVIQDALKAALGIGEWLPNYEDLKYERVRQAASVLV